MTNTVDHISLNKRATIWIGPHPVHSGLTVSETIKTLATLEVPAILSIQWAVVESAPVTIEKQNNTMLRRAKKIAAGIGREVEAFDQINGVIYGCVLV